MVRGEPGGEPPPDKATLPALSEARPMTGFLSAPVGVVGLGEMALPMSLSLLKARTPLLVWDCVPSKCEALANNGADLATEPAKIFARCNVVILGAADAAAMDAVLSRRCDRTFEDQVRGRMLINMAMPPPSYSKRLNVGVRAAGGRFVEAPVSVPRRLSEDGQPVMMLAGKPEDIAFVQPLFASICRHIIACGPIPNALLMKLAVDLFATVMTTGLTEAVNFAIRQGLNPGQLITALGASPAASDASEFAAEKLIRGDFSARTSILSVLENVELIAAAALERNVALPLLDTCHALYDEARALGLGNVDMVSVIQAIEQRTETLR